MFENQRKRSRYAKLISRFALRNETPADTEGTAKEPTPPKEDTTALKAALEKERLSNKEEKSRVAKIQADMEALQAKFADVNPDEYKTLLSEREFNAKTIAEREAFEAKVKKDSEAVTEKHKAELTDRENKLKAAQTRLLELEKQAAIKEAFLNASGNHRAAEDGVSHFQMFAALQGTRFQFDDKNNLIVVDAAGEPMLTEGKPVTPIEYIRSLHTHPILGNCFIPATPPSGTGGSHSSNANAAPVVKTAAQMTSAERQAAMVANYTKV